MGHILYKVHAQEPTYLTRILLVGCRYIILYYNYINLQLILQLDYNKYTLYVHVVSNTGPVIRNAKTRSSYDMYIYIKRQCRNNLNISLKMTPRGSIKPENALDNLQNR